MEPLTNFKTRLGEKMNKDEGTGGPVVDGKLEDSKKPHIFKPDFWFRNAPLLRQSDVVQLDDPKNPDWNFTFGKTFGFVKCTYKLVDGWEVEPGEEGEEDGEVQDVDEAAGAARDTGKGAPVPAEKAAPKAAAAPKTEESEDPSKKEPDEQDLILLKRTFGLDQKLDGYAFDIKKFSTRHKNKDNVPSRVRVRIYFVKAICIFGKDTDKGLFAKAFVDPYLSYKLGTSILVSMRNMAQFNTNVPNFYRVEERDIRMPAESRLQVDLFDYQDSLGETFNGEKLIGSTVIDLEDRWHSEEWKNSMDIKMQVATENRPLINPQLDGQNCGSIEMWVEMLDSVRASDIKAAVLTKPPAVEIEVRMVIRFVKNVKLMNGEKTDVKVACELECREFEGASMGFPKLQFTDVHFGSTGNAIFNWRFVFPRIVMPTKSCTFDFKLYQANTLSADEFIGAVSVDLRRYVEKVAKDMDAIYLEKGDLTVMQAAAGGGEGDGDGAEAAAEPVGQILFEMWVMTQSEADQKRAGKGREDPNDFPQLVTPSEGRGWGDVLGGFSFSLPDLGLMKKLLPLVIFVLLCLVLLKWIGLL
eukprot:TRINITY_DN27478_c0_g2_i3.p1 TRINITY_DN27478_c0_g2~~TRINITY_DN27478_c0_g2_i3.p1  ORF type:complete len:583 (-),score=160.86 TRINITY_DN27478_c0_g2_i3:112-1860(-)